jgi:hypothetical protein
MICWKKKKIISLWIKCWKKKKNVMNELFEQYKFIDEVLEKEKIYIYIYEVCIIMKYWMIYKC